MITKEHIYELKKIIHDLNQIEGLSDNRLEEHVEDVILLIKTLTEVKVQKLRKLLNYNSSVTKKVKDISYTKNEIITIFEKFDLAHIIDNYNSSQLEDMFIAIYNHKPLSKSTKKDIVYAINKMIQQINRANGFRELNNEN